VPECARDAVHATALTIARISNAGAEEAVLLRVLPRGSPMHEILQDVFARLPMLALTTCPLALALRLSAVAYSK
jgi:hypothetical protein